MKTIYYKNKSDKAKVVFEKYIIDDLDADDALRREVWSWVPTITCPNRLRSLNCSRASAVCYGVALGKCRRYYALLIWNWNAPSAVCNALVSAFISLRKSFCCCNC